MRGLCRWRDPLVVVVLGGWKRLWEGRWRVSLGRSVESFGGRAPLQTRPRAPLPRSPATRGRCGRGSSLRDALRTLFERCDETEKPKHCMAGCVGGCVGQVRQVGPSSAKFGRLRTNAARLTHKRDSWRPAPLAATAARESAIWIASPPNAAAESAAARRSAALLGSSRARARCVAGPLWDRCKADAPRVPAWHPHEPPAPRQETTVGQHLLGAPLRCRSGGRRGAAFRGHEPHKTTLVPDPPPG